MATMVTNAVPIVAGFVLFGERLPRGGLAVLQILAIGCLVLSAVALGHQQVPAAKQAPQAAVEHRAPGSPATERESG
jgi:hypothetical protein